MPSNSEKGKAPMKSEAASVGDGARFASQEISGCSSTGSSDNNGTLDRITSSASSLFQSLIQPMPSEASGAVGTSQASKSHASATSGGGGFYYWEEVSGSRKEHVQSLPSGKNPKEFRDSSAATHMAANDGEFQRFSNEAPPLSYTTVHREAITKLQSMSPQEDILQLLSSPTLTEAIWAPEPFPEEHVPIDAFRPNLLDSHVVEFLAADDIVEFLAREGTVYTEEVWGNMLGLLHEARAEIKGKEKEQGQNGSAIERLKMIRGQLRGKL